MKIATHLFPLFICFASSPHLPISPKNSVPLCCYGKRFPVLPQPIKIQGIGQHLFLIEIRLAQNFAFGGNDGGASHMAERSEESSSQSKGRTSP